MLQTVTDSATSSNRFIGQSRAPPLSDSIEGGLGLFRVQTERTWETKSVGRFGKYVQQQVYPVWLRVVQLGGPYWRNSPSYTSTSFFSTFDCWTIELQERALSMNMALSVNIPLLVNVALSSAAIKWAGLVELIIDFGAFLVYWSLSFAPTEAPSLLDQ